ncbi:MAG: hypothetical protein FD174_1650 [Geobacteraceae bacterium]|nr:MAG: hypothetical protein FD174_1650 [Geobacteraceae bacterium]
MELVKVCKEKSHARHVPLDMSQYSPLSFTQSRQHPIRAGHEVPLPGQSERCLMQKHRMMVPDMQL